MGIDVGFASKKTSQPQQHLMPRPRNGRSSHGRFASKPLLAQNRHRLSRLLDRLARAHNWKEASGVLSLLLKSTPQGSSLLEDRRNMLVAMEIQKRLVETGDYYQRKLKKVYEVWMGKLPLTKKKSNTRNSIQLELALFYLSNGNIGEAFNTTKFLAQDHNSASEPAVNLIHGLVLYKMWYSSLPEQMQIKDLDLHMLSKVSDETLTNVCDVHVPFVSSNGHNAVDVIAVNNSKVASESSVANERKLIGFKDEVKQQTDGALHYAELQSGSGMMVGIPSGPQKNYLDCSIFLAHGLEKDLLPIQLDHLSGDLEHTIHSYRRLANEHYDDAVKHLKQALCSTPPLFAALLPLVQLLLLGDRVGEALMELESASVSSNFALPSRLRARILESFGSNQVITIYEDALTRDPTCNQSLERLIKMHRTGNYGTIPLFDRIVTYLDCADGKSSIWEEFASCFLKILTCSIADYEDCISANEQGESKDVSSSDRIPRVFTEGQAKETWKVRCRWWRTRHFSYNAYLQTMQYGDWKLLASKAACASHLYGPKFEFVQAVYGSLTTKEDDVQLSFLQTHLKASLRLHDILT